MEGSWAHLVYCSLRQTMRPTVLIAMTTRWIPTVRLAMALDKAGFTVDAVCLPRHPLQKTKAAREIYVYNSLAPLRSFASAITASRPISSFRVTTSQPCSSMLYMSENSIVAERRAHLQCHRAFARITFKFSSVYARTGLLEIAQEEDIRVPKTEVLADVNQLREWGARRGFRLFSNRMGFGGEG